MTQSGRSQTKPPLEKRRPGEFKELEMRWLAPVICMLVAACGPTDAEKERIAQVTCAIISETKNMDSAERVERVNDAREELRLGPFLDGDRYITEAVKHGVCDLLVLDGNWIEPLEKLQAAEVRRLAEQEAAEAERLAEQERQRQIHREKFQAGEYDDEIKKCESLHPDNESQRRICQILAATTGKAK